MDEPERVVSHAESDKFLRNSERKKRGEMWPTYKILTTEGNTKQIKETLALRGNAGQAHRSSQLARDKHPYHKRLVVVAVYG